MTYESLLSYYKDRKIDPVPIPLSSEAAWDNHLAKRCNLYQLHLGLPLEFLRGRSIIEFGCNTGENALVLAFFGARLTLVEPHQAQHANLKKLFARFGLEQQIDLLSDEAIEDFEPEKSFDLVICENFINCLDRRDEMLVKVCQLVAPNGFGIISFDDRYGSLVEVFKKLIFHWVCQKQNIVDHHSQKSYDIAKQLFLEDFLSINASRPFSAWWEDVIINPFVSWRYLWSYQEIIPILEESGCEYYSGSPRWVTVDNLNWYKNIVEPARRHKAILELWTEHFAFIITGLALKAGMIKPATGKVVSAANDMVKAIETYITQPEVPVDSICYPRALDQYLGSSNVPILQSLNTEFKRILDTFNNKEPDEIIKIYHETESLRRLWGVPCQYICFRRLF